LGATIARSLSQLQSCRLGASGEPRAKLARADPIESRVEFAAGPAANNPGLRAVLRRHAPSATRQRTLEATGSTAGPVPFSKQWLAHPNSGAGCGAPSARSSTEPDGGGPPRVHSRDDLFPVDPGTRCGSRLVTCARLHAWLLLLPRSSSATDIAPAPPGRLRARPRDQRSTCLSSATSPSSRKISAPASGLA
jgi:hypothetical protein